MCSSQGMEPRYPRDTRLGGAPSPRVLAVLDAAGGDWVGNAGAIVGRAHEGFTADVEWAPGRHPSDSVYDGLMAARFALCAPAVDLEAAGADGALVISALVSLSRAAPAAGPSLCAQRALLFLFFHSFCRFFFPFNPTSFLSHSNSSDGHGAHTRRARRRLRVPRVRVRPQGLPHLRRPRVRFEAGLPHAAVRLRRLQGGALLLGGVRNASLARAQARVPGGAGCARDRGWCESVRLNV